MFSKIIGNEAAMRYVCGVGGWGGGGGGYYHNLIISSVRIIEPNLESPPRYSMVFDHFPFNSKP